MSEYILHATWRNMVFRCTSVKAVNHDYYHDCHIQENWKTSFEDFDSYCKSLSNYENRKRLKLTLDRIKPELGYVEGNLRWANKSEQAMNRRKKNTIRNNKMESALKRFDHESACQD